MELIKDEALTLHPVLHPCPTQIVEDHRLELPRRRVALAIAFGARAVVVGREHAVRRQALDGERACDAQLPVVLVWLVEYLPVGVPGDGGVDLLARHPLANVGIVADALEGAVWDSPVDEPLANVAVDPVARRDLAGELGFLRHAFLGVGEEVVPVLRSHEPCARG
ncbi:MAG: hypothetical protein M3373_13315 [Gemmatimonadota bacterium]|nr:hypothetical protein [Gemmatimonadota bacterium]